MTNTVLLKRSATANSAPSAGSLLYGELAINYADGNLYYLSSSNVVTVLASNKTLSLSGNVTAGNINTGGIVSATGNITGNYFLGNGAFLTGITASGNSISNGNSNVVIPTANGNVFINAGGYANAAKFDNLGNITAGHWLVANGLRIIGDQPGENYSVIITGNAEANLMTMTSMFALEAHVQSNLGNFYGGNLNIISDVAATGFISAAGNITTSANVAGNYVLGNGAFLTGISASGSGNSISNGTSNVVIPTANGAINISSNGVPNVAVFSSGSLTLAGSFATPKTTNVSSTVSENVNAMLLGPVSIGAGTTITIPNSSTLYVYSP